MPDRILVRSTNWIGDAVISVAALRELRRLYPSAKISVLANSWVAGIYESQDLADEILTHNLNRISAREFVKVSRGLSNFDVAVLFQNAFRAALLAWLAGIPRRIGYATDVRKLLLTCHAKPRMPRLYRHQVFYYLDLLFLSGLSPVDYAASDFQPDISLHPTRRGLEEASQLLRENQVDMKRRLVALNPGAYFGSAKRWLVDRYARLADLIIEETESNIVIIGSANEVEIAKQIQELMSRPAFPLAGKTTLPGLMGLLSLCRLMITNDSGPMHLGAALGIPQIAIFGSTDARATGPLNPKAVVIRKSVECSPCLLRECPIDLRCFTRIEVEEVLEAAKKLL
ncbi:MAG: lipopolysaccharide heptosyltransferase II [Acidobacteria bacterium]|nr:lipopolysaccharide heptosyltransferase II [Acidobacteriota bacterium]